MTDYALIRCYRCGKFIYSGTEEYIYKRPFCFECYEMYSKRLDEAIKFGVEESIKIFKEKIICGGR